MFEVVLIEKPMERGEGVRIGLFAKREIADLFRIVLEELLTPGVRILVRPRSSVYMLDAIPRDVLLSELGVNLLDRFSERLASNLQTPGA